MASEPIQQEDPLVAALPPATDYMTYLTLLEYQLTPENLPTLSRLLAEDDGTLAEEIGWDLLKLVLPMLATAPEEADRCLEIIARRGNPREVVVRVAEELEKLSDETDGVENEDEEVDDDEDELPTFEGEAPRVHLGKMKLEGMPEGAIPTASDSVADGPTGGAAETTLSDRSSKLRALLNMLGILHPRIKTQFPSRFLATSLPAALGAYRKTEITTPTTQSFLNMLGKLAGKQRPALPPRVGSATAPGSEQTGLGIDLPTSAAPLPDPEAHSESAAGGDPASSTEKAIINRLLQAVMLEVLDEYTSSLALHDEPCLAWTSRLREKYQPKRVVQGRPTETEIWGKTPELQERDNLISTFLKLGGELELDINSEVKKLVYGDDATDYHDDPEQEPSEYPTNPSQIPFPRAGVIILKAAHGFANAEDTPGSDLSANGLADLTTHSFPLALNPSIPTPGLQDALLSLLYMKSLSAPNSSQIASPTSPTSPPNRHPTKFLLLLSTVTQLFTITPNAALRDSSHHIATTLLHNHPSATVRLQVIMQTLQGTTTSTNWLEEEDEDYSLSLSTSVSTLKPVNIPLAPPQQLGALKAVATNWLKDEVSLFLSPPATSTDPVGLNPSILTSAPESPSLLNLLFPRSLPSLPSADPATLEVFLPNIPHYIATLNLLTILYAPTSPPLSQTLLSRAESHMKSLKASTEVLLGLLQLSGGGAVPDDLRASTSEIFALEDAVRRAEGSLDKYGTYVAASEPTPRAGSMSGADRPQAVSA